MGTWSAKIYDDDTALDIRQDFIDKKRNKTSIKEIEDCILDIYLEGEDHIDDNAILALCCAELETGTLSKRTKAAALEVIESNRQIEYWTKNASKEDTELRKKELQTIKKYIETYKGDPIKRKSWIELQKMDKNIDTKNQNQNNNFISKFKKVLLKILSI